MPSCGGPDGRHETPSRGDDGGWPVLGLCLALLIREVAIMKHHRPFGETFIKSARKILTTPPNTWYRQWKRAFSPAVHRGVPSSRSDYLGLDAAYSGSELLVGGMQVMQEWERPLMRALAKEASRGGGHVLEVGFGMGISADYLIEAGCAKYTVIEPHAGVLSRFAVWAQKQPIAVNAVPGFWEDVIDDLPLFDGILFDTYPVSQSETSYKVYLPFIPKASEHLKPGGVLTFYTGYPDALPWEQRVLLKKHFSSVEYYQITDLKPPSECDYYHDSKMVVPVCVK